MAGTEDRLRVRVRLVRRWLKATGHVAATNRRVHALATDTAGQLADLAQQLADGEISQTAFLRDGEALLVAAGMAASALGDVLGQVLAGAGEADIEDDEATADDRRDWVTALVAGRLGYLRGYADDIQAGGTDGTGISPAAIAARAALWGGLAWTAYQMARGQRAVATGQSEATWLLDEGAEHCDDCLALADGSPYTADDLPGYPGDADTACLSNCRCEIQWSTPEGSGEP